MIGVHDGAGAIGVLIALARLVSLYGAFGARPDRDVGGGRSLDC